MSRKKFQIVFSVKNSSLSRIPKRGIAICRVGIVGKGITPLT